MRLKVGIDPVINITKEIESNPNDDDAYYRRSKFYRNQGEDQLGYNDLNRAIELNPNKPEYYGDLAKIFTRWTHNIDFNKARECLKKSISISSNEKYKEKCYVELSETYNAENDMDSAIKVLDDIIQLYPESVDAYLSRGRLHIETKRGLSAARDFTKLTLLLPKCRKKIGSVMNLSMAWTWIIKI